jgi:hypothetical protein
MKLTANDAFELSKRFRDLSTELGDFRYENWKKLTPKQRQDLENREWSLLNHSSDLLTAAVGLVLDEAEASFEELRKSTDKARKAVRTLKTVRKIINVATAAVGLSAAVLSKDLGAIGKNAKNLFEAAS